MGDMGIAFRGLRRLQKGRKADMRERNLEVLGGSGLEFDFRDVNGGICRFREPGKPKVYFFLTTGRWTGGGKVFSGGARSFLGWYEKQVSKCSR